MLLLQTNDVRTRGLWAVAGIILSCVTWGCPSATRGPSHDTIGGDTTADTAADSSDQDTVTDTGGGDTVADTVVPTISLTLHLTDFLSTSPLVGLSVTILGETATSDSDGTVTLTVPPNADLAISVTGSGLRDHYLYHHTDTADATLSYPLATDSTVAALEAVLQLTVDDSKGLAEIATFEQGTGTPIPGLRITTDATSDLELVLDPAAAGGLSAGNTTLAGAPSAVIFVNLTAGAVTPSFDHPWGWTCEGPSPLDVPAGAYVLAEYRCTYTPVQIGLRLTDFVSTTAVVGATVAVQGQTLTSDAEGLVTFSAPPNDDVEAVVTGAGMRDHYIYLRTPDHDAVIPYALATDTTVSGLEAVLGLTVDDTKGILELALRVEGTLESIPGLTVTLDVAAELALVFDASSSVGISAGNTTLAGSPSTVIFVNAIAGAVTPSFTDSAGYVCDVGPIPVDLPAGSYVIADYACHLPPVF